MMLSLRAFAAAALFGALPISIAAAQNPYIETSPVDVVILTDWSHAWFPDGVGNGPVPEQSEAQQTKNRLRLTPKPSKAATRTAYEEFVAPLAHMDDDLGNIAQNAIDRPHTNADYIGQMQAAGLNPEDLSDVITAYTLAAYQLAHTKTPNLSGIATKDRAAATRAVRTTLIAYLPAGPSQDDLRAVLETTRGEHILLLEAIKSSANDTPDDKVIVRGYFLERSEDYVLVNVAESKLDPIKGFIER